MMVARLSAKAGIAWSKASAEKVAPIKAAASGLRVPFPCVLLT
jgi:hypothetical protein